MLAPFFSTVSQAESVAIKAPQTIAAILHVIGPAKAAFTDQPAALPASKEKLAIEDQHQSAANDSDPESSDVDENIPF